MKSMYELRVDEQMAAFAARPYARYGRGERLAALAGQTLALSVMVSIAVAALCGAAVAVKATADFLAR